MSNLRLYEQLQLTIVKFRRRFIPGRWKRMSISPEESTDLGINQMGGADEKEGSKARMEWETMVNAVFPLSYSRNRQ